MSQILVECPSPACSAREVKDGEVSREQWEATWLGPDPHPGYWHSNIACPSCGTEGIDPESGQLDSAEEELGVRCGSCGVVSDSRNWASYVNCPSCGAAYPDLSITLEDNCDQRG